MITPSRKSDAVDAIVAIADDLAMSEDFVGPEAWIRSMDRLMVHAKTVQDYYRQESHGEPT